jgi:hypothetical protein
VRAWRRLLVRLGLARPPLELSARREPYFGPSNVIDLQRERRRRMPPIMFVGFVSEQDVLDAARRRGAESKVKPFTFDSRLGRARE